MCVIALIHKNCGKVCESIASNVPKSAPPKDFFAIEEKTLKIFMLYFQCVAGIALAGRGFPPDGGARRPCLWIM
jgi:hypothetical protein